MKRILILCIIVVVCVLAPASAADHKVTFQNHCSYPVAVNSIIGPLSTFPAGAPAAGASCSACSCSATVCCPSSICPEVKCAGVSSCKSGQPLPDGGGFRLKQVSSGVEDSHSLTVKNGWQVAFWGRTGCSDAADMNCATGSARSNVDNKDKLQAGGIGSMYPATKGEIKFDGYGNQDYYDISIVDGYNLPVQIELVPGTYQKTNRQDTAYDCTVAGGGADLNAKVMAATPLLAYNVSGKTVGVYSACKYSYATLKVENKEYCCLPPYGEYKDRNKNNGQYCDPTKWPANLNSASLFKANYPLAYSYADDDEASTFTCKNAGPAKDSEYLVTFCSGDEGSRIFLPGQADHTHLPDMSPTPIPTPVPTPSQPVAPEQTPVPQAPYNPVTSGEASY
jgi:hypothetical protein